MARGGRPRARRAVYAPGLGHNGEMRRLVLLVVAAVTLAPTAVTGAAVRDPGLPNPAKTPGALNPRVTQATIYQTICVSGYTSTIRPAESYTQNLKYQQLDSGYNYQGDTNARDYEEDHQVPLEVGGSPTSVKNLWPEPRYVTWGASRKDVLENKIHSLVCSGAMTLAQGQRIFMTNWIPWYQRYYGN